MKEFSDSLPASELKHLWLNIFNYFRKYICVHLHFTCNEVFIQHTKKIEKKTSIEAQSKGHALEHKTSESRLTKTNLKRMLCWKREISATLIQLHLKELCCEHGKCYSHTLALSPDIRPYVKLVKRSEDARYFFSKSW